MKKYEQLRIEGIELPDEDILWALHAYCEYYGHGTGSVREDNDYKDQHEHEHDPFIDGLEGLGYE